MPTGLPSAVPAQKRIGKVDLSEQNPVKPMDFLFMHRLDSPSRTYVLICGVIVASPWKVWMNLPKMM